MNKAWILSAKFAPGHFSHMIAYYELFRAVGYEPLLYLTEEYRPFCEEVPDCRCAFLPEKPSDLPDVILLYNLSSHDRKIIKRLRRENPYVRLFYVHHEPWMGLGSWLSDLFSGRESFIDSLKTWVRHILVRPIVKNCERVLCPSEKAYELYRARCMRLNPRVSVFPLVFTDEAGEILSAEEKKYFSFVATVQNAKNFTGYLNYIKHRAAVDPASRFMIATRTDISSYLDAALREMMASGRLVVTHGHPLSNEEINRAYAESKCLWMLYSRSTQSGALCKSFMFGTPVIASDIGSFREYVDGENGVVLQAGYSFADIDAAYERILGAERAYSESARQTFLREFLWTSQKELFSQLVSEKTQD